MDATIPSRSVLEKTLGRWMLGMIADFILMGIMASMAVEYRARYRDSDGPVYKYMVAILMLFSILKTVQAGTTVWYMFVLSFGDYSRASFVSPWSVKMDPLTAEICNIIAQIFFSYRLYRLMGGLRWVLVPLVPAMLLGLAGHTTMSAQAFNMSTVNDLSVFTKGMYIGLVGVLAADIIITVATSWYLLHSKTGFSRTDGLIFRLLHLTWITAALPSLSAFLNLVLFLTLSSKGESIFVLFTYMSPKLYGVSMLYTLNARQRLRSVEDSYAMGGSRIERMTGISVARETVRVVDGPETHPTSIKLQRGGKTLSGGGVGRETMDSDIVKSHEV